MISPQNKIVGSSEAVGRVLRDVAMVAPTDAPVLILGESGTGKELVAQAVHAASRRANGPLVAVNCASVPAELFESEFFGHAKGAFTGAVVARQGKVQRAQNGTLFLDEVGDLPVACQAKLLRLLQEGEYEPLGLDTPTNANIRIIAATNRDIIYDHSTFRQDLLYRLAVYPIFVPPLRDRTVDIKPLVEHFIVEACAKFGLSSPPLTEQQLQNLIAHPWPGNIRELKHTVERAVITSQGSKHLAFRLEAFSNQTERAEREDPANIHVLTEKELRDLESENYRRALLRAEGKIYGPQGAGALLGIAPTTLASRLRNLGIHFHKS